MPANILSPPVSLFGSEPRPCSLSGSQPRHSEAMFKEFLSRGPSSSVVSPVISNSPSSPLPALRPETRGFGDPFSYAPCASGDRTHTWGHMPRGLREGQSSVGPLHGTGHSSSCWSGLYFPWESLSAGPAAHWPVTSIAAAWPPSPGNFLETYLRDWGKEKRVISLLP